MRRFLLVGCGGSGGAVLAHTMHRLRSDLAARGVERLPVGWQFVYVDVSAGGEPGPEGLPTVVEQGGTYVGCGPDSADYSALDAAVAGRLSEAGRLDTVATWAPRVPRNVRGPISMGSGQARAIGRMITLGRAARVHRSLLDAWQLLSGPRALSESTALSRSGSAEAAPVVLVVGSAAGGAGASMVLDVARLLAAVPGVDPQLTGLFILGPDLWDGLSEMQLTGVRPNALAMLGEIVAAQAGAAGRFDNELFGALGIPPGGSGSTPPFGRVFPVGRTARGTRGTVLAGLGHALAALMTSAEGAEWFVRAGLGGSGRIPYIRELAEWAVTRREVRWGAFGSARLSVGGDRYAEYAAQRLARSCVDRLRGWHVDGEPEARSDPDASLRLLVDRQWWDVCRGCGLPAPGDDVGNWIADEVVVVAELEDEAAGIVGSLLQPVVPDPVGRTVEAWESEVRREVGERSGVLVGDAEEIAERVVRRWGVRLSAAVEAQARTSVVRFGLPFADAVLDRLVRHITEGAWLDRFTDLPALPSSGLPNEVENVFRLWDGRLADFPEPMAELDGMLNRSVTAYLLRRCEELLPGVLRDVAADVVAPLREAVDAARRAWDEAMSPGGASRGPDAVRPGDWPRETGSPAAAVFGEAPGEVMLVRPESFPRQYALDLQRSVARARPPGETPGETEGDAVTAVILGTWPSAGGPAPPDDLLERHRPDGPLERLAGERLTVPAGYELRVRPPDLLSRARRFVARPGGSFADVGGMSLRRWASTDFGPGSRDEQWRSLRSACERVLALARPAGAADGRMLSALHGEAPPEISYTFSEIPLAGTTAGRVVTDLLAGPPAADASTIANLSAALSDDPHLTHVDVFATSPPCSPAAAAWLAPVAQQWRSGTELEREAFWRWRRSRPLPAALPLSDDDRRAMVLGYMLGHVLGWIRLPADSDDAPAQVFDATADRWVRFPHPLLTPRSRFEANYDWLPAVLESILLAFARASEPPILSSLRPYRVLRRIARRAEPDNLSMLADWLADPDRTGGGPSSVPDADAAASVDDRARLATAWLGSVRDLAGVHYMALGEDGAPGGGTFSTVTEHTRAKTPLFRDVAPDVYAVTTQLIELVEECRAEAAGGPGPRTASGRKCAYCFAPVPADATSRRGNLPDDCPDCGRPYPPGWLDAPSVCIALVGGAGSGKTVLRAAMLRELEEAAVAAGVEMIPVGRDLQDEFERHYVRDAPLPPATVITGDRTARSVSVVRLGAGATACNLAIHDVGGEDLGPGSPDRLDRADHLFLLVDPLQFPTIRQLTRGLIPSESVPATGFPSMELDVLRRSGAPCAVIVTKFDVLQALGTTSGGDLARIMSNSGSTLLRDPGSLLRYDEADGALLHEEVRSLLDTLDAGLLVRAAELVTQHRFFAVSALGPPPLNGHAARRPLLPFRCLDPLSWVLAAKGGVAVSSAVTGARS